MCIASAPLSHPNQEFLIHLRMCCDMWKVIVEICHAHSTPQRIQFNPAHTLVVQLSWTLRRSWVKGRDFLHPPKPSRPRPPPPSNQCKRLAINVWMGRRKILFLKENIQMRRIIMIRLVYACLIDLLIIRRKYSDNTQNSVQVRALGWKENLLSFKLINYQLFSSFYYTSLFFLLLALFREHPLRAVLDQPCSESYCHRQGTGKASLLCAPSRGPPLYF